MDEKKAGRKSKYGKEELLEKIRDLAGQGLTDVQIAQSLGVHPNTLYKWKAGKYPEIVSALEVGRVLALSRVENILFKRALGYEWDMKREVELTIEDAEGQTKTVKRRETVTRHVPPSTHAIQVLMEKLAFEMWGDGHYGIHSLLDLLAHRLHHRQAAVPDEGDNSPWEEPEQNPRPYIQLSRF